MSDPAYKNKKDLGIPPNVDWTDADDRAKERESAAIRLGRTQAAMQMFVDGHDYPEIASTLGYGSAEAAATDVREALEEEFLTNAKYSAEILRMVELKRLNYMYNALIPGITRGNSRAVDVGVKISDRISKMSGLDAPVRTETAVEMQLVDAEILRLKREIAERQAAAIEAPILDVEVED